MPELEEELRVQKDGWWSEALPASGLADKVGEQDHQLETSACPSAKLGGVQGILDEDLGNCDKAWSGC